MLKCLKSLIRSSHATKHPLLRFCSLEDNRMVGGGDEPKEEREKKEYSAKDYGSEAYIQYLEEVAPVPPSHSQGQRDQILLRHFSHEQMSTVQQENEGKGDTELLERA